MQTLWLRYLSEIGEHTVSVPEDLLSNPEINEAIKAIEVVALTPAQLLDYEKFRDMISTQRTLLHSAEQQGLAKEIKAL